MNFIDSFTTARIAPLSIFVALLLVAVISFLIYDVLRDRNAVRLSLLDNPRDPSRHGVVTVLNSAGHEVLKGVRFHNPVAMTQPTKWMKRNFIAEVAKYGYTVKAAELEIVGTRPTALSLA